MKLLAKADLPHGMDELLAIIGPSPASTRCCRRRSSSSTDDHRALRRPGLGERSRAPAAPRRGASAFIEELARRRSIPRLVYVAGYDQPTPLRRFAIDCAREVLLPRDLDGDGRVTARARAARGVPHVLGDEIHGELAEERSRPGRDHGPAPARRRRRAPTAKPPEPAPVRAARRGWIAAAEIAPVDPAIDTILAGACRAANRADTQERSELENLGSADYLGTGGEPRRWPASPVPRRDAARAPISVEVVWGDVTRSRPMSTPSATTRASCRSAPSSRSTKRSRASTARRGLRHCATARDHQHTRRGMLRGALGDVVVLPVGTATSSTKARGRRRHGPAGHVRPRGSRQLVEAHGSRSARSPPPGPCARC